MNGDAENIYFKGLIGIVARLMCKEMYLEMYKKCDGCVNEEPGQQSHDYCLLVDRVTRATESFNSAFSKVNICLVNELCFKNQTISIPVRDIDLHKN